jgi:hypothetical protein
MLEFGNVMRAAYGASVITSAYAASNSTSSDETEAQDVVEYLNDPVFTSYQRSATGATEAISTVQTAVDQTGVVKKHLEHIQEIVEDLSEGGLTEEEQTELIAQVEAYVEEIEDVIEDHPFLGPEGEDLVISIGHGSSITVQSQDLSISIEDVDLTTSEGLVSFSESVSSQIESVEEYGDLLEDQLDRLSNATQIIEYTTESELGASTEGIDSDAAIQVASMAASQVIEDMSVLFGMEDSLDNDTVTALLEDSE